MSKQETETPYRSQSAVDGIVSNFAECSGCGKKKVTVSRSLFDGMCADCTNIALYNDKFRTKAKKRNNELITHL